MRRPTKNMKGTNYVKNGGLKSMKAPGGGVMMKSQLLDQQDNEEDEYDNEYDDEEEDDEGGEDFYSQQDYEVHAFVFDPLKVELEDYLKTEDYFHYRFENPMIKKLTRSLSVNHAVEYEMTEDEVEAIRTRVSREESAVPLQAAMKHETVAESNPYM